LDSAWDLAALLQALQLREKDQKDQRVHCEASSKGLKLVAQSGAKDVAVLGWMLNSSFREYRFTGLAEDVHLKLPVAPLLSCLTVFSDRASLVLRYRAEDEVPLHLTMEEEGAVTECRVRTMMLDEAPAAFGSFFAQGEPTSVLRPAQPEAWYHALLEFAELDGLDVALRVTLRALDPSVDPSAPAVVLRAQTVTSDAEVELPHGAFEAIEVPEDMAAGGEVTHGYPLSSVLSSCLRAAKDAKGVKIRFNRDGVMSNQFILKGRGQADLFCEALVSPLAEFPGAPTAAGAPAAGASAGAGAGPTAGAGFPAGESLGF